MTADTARKLAFAGVSVNFIVLVFPGVGTIVQFLRIQSLLALQGVDSLFSFIVTVGLFASYVIVGMILPVIALQITRPADWHAVLLILLVGGAVTVFSFGGMLLVLAAVLLISAGPDDVYRLAQSSGANTAEALGDQMSVPQPAAVCPICGADLKADEHTCPFCFRRMMARGWG